MSRPTVGPFTARTTASPDRSHQPVDSRMSRSPSSSPGISDEDLVAYLDQEVDTEQARHIETRLLSDEDFRHQLTDLEKPFELLDLLPRTEAGEAFTRTTISRVTLDQARRETRSPWRRRLAVLAVMAGLVVVVSLLGVGAFLVARYRADEPNRKLLADLSLLKDFDSLREVGSLAWLERLQEDELFLETDPLALVEGGTPLSEGPRSIRTGATGTIDLGPATASLPAVLTALPPEEGRRIVRNIDRLAALPAKEQADLRALATSIDRRPAASELWRIARRYLDFISHREATVRAELRGLDFDHRVARIQELQQDDLIEELVGQTQLSKPDAKALLAWMANYQDRHLADYEKLMGGGPRGHGLPGPPGEPLSWPIRGMLFWRYENEYGTPIPRPTSADLATLASSLTPPVQTKLDQAKSVDDKVRLIWGWTKNAAMQTLLATQEELMAFHERLPEADKRQLLGLTPEEFQRQLQIRYRRQFGPPMMPFGPGRGLRDGRGGPRPDGPFPPEGRQPADGPFGIDGPPPPPPEDRGPDWERGDGFGRPPRRPPDHGGSDGTRPLRAEIDPVRPPARPPSDL